MQNERNHSGTLEYPHDDNDDNVDNDNDNDRQVRNGDSPKFTTDVAEEGVNGEENDHQSKFEDEETSHKRLSHFVNPEIPLRWRYFVVAFLVSAFVLLLVADLGSGVAADYILRRPTGEIFVQRTLIEVSIFSSVRELWDTGSYPLAIFVAMTSVMWPYVKLLLSFYAWVVPFKNARGRERLIEIVDAFDKWSFVDIFVLLIIIVAFRANVKIAFGGAVWLLHSRAFD